MITFSIFRMFDLDELQENLGGLWIPEIYRNDVRSQRTRSMSMDISERENSPDILHTLLGVELKINKLRVACPDLATARYLRVFARIGCREIAVPYDITKISKIADDLETAWQRMNLFLEGSSARIRNKAIGRIREEIGDIGAGEAMPEFKQTTKQRNV